MDRKAQMREIKINSFDELFDHEREILERIKRIPNGGHLFLVHPFMLLADIGVELSERAKEEIVQQEPTLATVSALPYHALRRSEKASRLRVHLRGLFQRSQS